MKRIYIMIISVLIILTACSKLIESDNVNSGSTKQYDSFADITIGGGDFTFDRIFIESTCDTAFFDRIIGVEELTKFINEEIEPNKLKRQSVPIVYKIIQHFDIPKETVIEHNKKTIAFNKENGTNTTTFDDYIIDALYCNDEEKMKKTLKSPYVLYQNQEFYTIYDVIKMSPEKLLALGLSQESLLLYSSELEDAFKSFGYDSEATKEAFKKLTTNIKSIQKNN